MVLPPARTLAAAMLAPDSVPGPWSEGFAPAPVPPAARQELASLLGESDLTFGPALVRSHQHGIDVLVDATWTEAARKGSRITITRTVLLLVRPEASLPDFEILPTRHVGDRIAAAASTLVGIPSLAIADHPEFSALHHVRTANPASVRAILDRRTLDAFAVLGDLRVKVSGRAVLLSRAGHGVRRLRGREEVLDDAGRRRLLEDGLAACASFAEGADASRRADAAVPGTYEDEAIAEYQRSGGLVGVAARRLLVTREMIESLRGQQIPRLELPPQIRRRIASGTTAATMILSFMGIVFLAIGIGTVGGLAPRGAGGSTLRVVFAAFGAVMLVVAFLLVRHRRIRRRILERGVVVEGVVESVEVTAVTVNNDRIHRVTLRLDGAADPVVVKVGSAEARAATRLQVAAARTWVLQDPLKTSRAIWCEGWLLSAGR